MNDEKILNIILKKETINNETLNDVLYRLCFASNHKDTLQYYRHIPWNVYNNKIYKILNYTCKQIWYSIKVTECKTITNEDIKNEVDILPTCSLIKFIKASISCDYIIIDYENYDEIHECYSLLDVLQTSCIQEVIKNLEQSNIDNIIEYIHNLDLFDIELFKEYNNL